jgi:4-hydroxyphenylpyruvate dioxygenase-like putative hemolysin
VEGKSIEQNWLKQHGETVHHIGIRVENLEEEVLKWEKKGIKVVQEDHGKWVYLDAENILGTMVELFNPKSLDVFV